MVALVDALQEDLKFTLEALGYPLAEDLRDLIGGEVQKAQFAGALEKFVDGKGIAEDEVQAIFHLAQGIKTVQVHDLSFPFGKLGAEKKGPVVEALAEQFWGQPMSSVGESLGVANQQEGIVLLTERDAHSIQLRFQKVVPVDVIGGLERKKGAYS